MVLRILVAVLLGLAGALFLAVFGYYNDHVIELEALTAGDLLPLSVFGVLIVLVVVVNPVLYLIWRPLRLRPAELAIILVTMLVACSVAGGGLMQHYTATLMMPIVHNADKPGWRKMELLEYTPPALLPCDAHYDLKKLPDSSILQGVDPTSETYAQLQAKIRNAEEVAMAVNTFTSGIDKPKDVERISLRQHKPGKPAVLDEAGKVVKEEIPAKPGIPWRQWEAPLKAWLPMVVMLGIASVCIGLIVHRQWSAREHLRYPIADLANTLMGQDEGKAVGSIFRNKIFWLGLAFILGIRVINGIQGYYKESIGVPLFVDFTAVRQQWPDLFGTRYGGWLFYPSFFPTVIAFSFFLSSEIALSLGLSQWILIPIASILINRYGMDNFDGGYMSGGASGWQRFGSYFAFALIILYLGRRHYWLVLRQALTFRSHKEVEGYTVWACRIGLLSSVGVVWYLTSHGLAWPIAAITVALMLMTVLCVARIAAETGLFMVHPRWQALGILLGLFGVSALGPQPIIIVGLACAILSIDQGQTLLPYLINGLKICDDAKVKPKHIGIPVGLVFALCVVVVVTAALWCSYNYGVNVQENRSFTLDRVPTMTYRAAQKAIYDLEAWGKLDESKGLGTWDRFRQMRPDPLFLKAAGIGFVLVIVVSALRQRLPWWPLHPVMFLLWGTNPMATFHHSFLLGWLIRAGVMKYAGHSAIRKSKPLMVGIIAGDLLGGALFMAIGVIYYQVTGHNPPSLNIFKR